MKDLTKTEAKNIFKKIRRLVVPDNLESIEFIDLKYFSWLDQKNQAFYTIYSPVDKIEGIRWRVSRLPSKALSAIACDVCNKPRRRDEIISIYAPTRHLPKNLAYRIRGFFICSDFSSCNSEMKNEAGIKKIYELIIAAD